MFHSEHKLSAKSLHEKTNEDRGKEYTKMTFNEKLNSI